MTPFNRLILFYKSKWLISHLLIFKLTWFSTVTRNQGFMAHLIYLICLSIYLSALVNVRGRVIGTSDSHGLPHGLTDWTLSDRSHDFVVGGRGSPRCRSDSTGQGSPIGCEISQTGSVESDWPCEAVGSLRCRLGHCCTSPGQSRWFHGRSDSPHPVESDWLWGAEFGLSPQTPTASHLWLPWPPTSNSHGLPPCAREHNLSDWLRQITWQNVGGCVQESPNLSKSASHGLPRPPTASHGLPQTLWPCSQ